MSAQSMNDRAAYGLPEASQYLRMNPSTLRAWTKQNALIRIPREGYLSFNNLVEAHVLKALRRNHQFSMQSLHKTLPAAAAILHTERPLLEASFATDGINLFIEIDDSLVNLTKHGQVALRDLVSLYLQRIGRSAKGDPVRLYPFIVEARAAEPKSISISPTVAFGRSVLAGTGIATEVIAGRFAGRDSIADLAKEYQVPASVIEDAIRWETPHLKVA